MSQQLAAVPPLLLAHLPLSPTDRVLDFGAGTGLLATQIAPKVAHVTALDMSAAMLQVLDEKGVANITTHHGDIFDGLPGRYHAIVSCMALHHVADTAALMRAFAAALHPGGRIALVDLYAEDGSFHGDQPGVAHHGFDRGDLGHLITDAGFDELHFAAAHNMTKTGDDGAITGVFPIFLATARRPADASRRS